MPLFWEVLVSASFFHTTRPRAKADELSLGVADPVGCLVGFWLSKLTGVFNENLARMIRSIERKF